MCPHARHLQGSVPSAPLIMQPRLHQPRADSPSGPGASNYIWAHDPLPFLPCRGRGTRLVHAWSPHFCKWSGVLSERAPPLLLVPGLEARDQGVRGPRRWQGPSRGSEAGAAADAVDITAESALLSRRGGSRRAFTLLPAPRPPAPSWCLGRTAAGGGEKGRWRGVR